MAAACRAAWFTVVAALSLVERGGAPGALDAEDALEFFDCTGKTGYTHHTAGGTFVSYTSE